MSSTNSKTEVRARARARAKLAAAVVAALAVGAAGVAGCRLATSSSSANPSAAAVAQAIAQGASGLAGVQSHTQSADSAVKEAVPHADPVGQAHLATASTEHAAVMAEGSKLQQAMDALERELQAANSRIAVAQEQVRGKEQELAHQQELQRELENRWYVRGGRFLERMFWTLAVGYLAVTVASGLLGLGNPLGWFGRVRGLIAGSTQGWIGSAFVK